MSVSGGDDASDREPCLPIEDSGIDFDAQFSWTFTSRNDCLALALVGRIGNPPSPTFTEQVERVLGIRRPGRLLIELDACQHIASGALGYLVRFFRAATAHGGQVLGVGANRHVRGLIGVLGIDSFLLLVDDHDTAERFFRAQGH